MQKYAVGQNDERPWGGWEVLDIGNDYVVKRIRIRPNGRLSLQRHQHREERWTVAQGIVQESLDGQVLQLGVGQSVAIGPRAIHRAENVTPFWAVFVELQLGSILSEDDIERLEDSYGRS